MDQIFCNVMIFYECVILLPRSVLNIMFIWDWEGLIYYHDLILVGLFAACSLPWPDLTWRNDITCRKVWDIGMVFWTIGSYDERFPRSIFNTLGTGKWIFVLLIHIFICRYVFFMQFTRRTQYSESGTVYAHIFTFVPLKILQYNYIL